METLSVVGVVLLVAGLVVAAKIWWDGEAY